MEITPEASLQIIADLLKRAPMSNAEMIGAQIALNKLESISKEWKDFKNPPAPLAQN